jgi:hypothetical protein
VNSTVRPESSLIHGHDEASFSDRAVHGNKGRNGIGGSIQCGQCDLWIGDRILRALESGTAASRGRLCVALRAAVAVERRPQSRPGLACESTRHGIHLHESLHRFREHGLFARIQGWVKASGSRRATPGTGILLPVKVRGTERHKQTETHHQRQKIRALHLAPLGGRRHTSAQSWIDGFMGGLARETSHLFSPLKRRRCRVAGIPRRLHHPQAWRLPQELG